MEAACVAPAPGPAAAAADCTAAGVPLVADHEGLDFDRLRDRHAPLTSLRDAYGFEVRPEYAELHKRFAPVWEAEEEERCERWESFLSGLRQQAAAEGDEGSADSEEGSSYGAGDDGGDAESPPSHSAAAEEPPSDAQLLAGLLERCGAEGGGDMSPRSAASLQQLRALVQAGLPMAKRGEYWKAFLGVAAKRSPGAYARLVSEALDDGTSTSTSARSAAGQAGSPAGEQPSTPDQGTRAPSASACNAGDGAGRSTPPSAGTASAASEAGSSPLGLPCAERSERWGGGRSDWLAQIDKDLHRTFPGHPLMDAGGRGTLRRVLAAYARRNPRVGYCQGLNFVAACFLLVLDEEDAFWCLAAVVEDLLPGYFDGRMLAPQVDQRVFGHLLSGAFPSLAAHLGALDVDAASVTMHWFLCLFVNSLPMGSALRVWDALFFERSAAVLHRVALALLDIYHQALVETGESSDAYMLLQALAPMSFDASRLVDTALIGHGGVRPSTLRVLRARYRPEVLAAMRVSFSSDEELEAYGAEAEAEGAAAGRSAPLALALERLAAAGGSPGGVGLPPRTPSGGAAAGQRGPGGSAAAWASRLSSRAAELGSSGGASVRQLVSRVSSGVKSTLSSAGRRPSLPGSAAQAEEPGQRSGEPAAEGGPAGADEEGATNSPVAGAVLPLWLRGIATSATRRASASALGAAADEAAPPGDEAAAQAAAGDAAPAAEGAASARPQGEAPAEQPAAASPAPHAAAEPEGVPGEPSPAAAKLRTDGGAAAALDFRSPIKPRGAAGGPGTPPGGAAGAADPRAKRRLTLLSINDPAAFVPDLSRPAVAAAYEIAAQPSPSRGYVRTPLSVAAARTLPRTGSAPGGAAGSLVGGADPTRTLRFDEDGCGDESGVPRRHTDGDAAHLLPLAAPPPAGSACEAVPAPRRPSPLRPSNHGAASKHPPAGGAAAAQHASNGAADTAGELRGQLTKVQHEIEAKEAVLEEVQGRLAGVSTELQAAAAQLERRQAEAAAAQAHVEARRGLLSTRERLIGLLMGRAAELRRGS